MRIRDRRIGTAVASTLLAASLLVGCSGSTETASTDEVAGTETIEEVATEEEEDSLDPATIAGLWVADKAGSATLDESLSAGLFQSFEFDEDGTFIMEVHVYDQKLVREGTYRIEGEQLFISAPAVEKTESDNPDDLIKSISAKAIEDAEVIIVDENTMTTTGIASDASETVMRKISSDEYDSYVEQATAKAPKEVAVGEEASNEMTTFTVDSLEFVDEIYPSDTSGYYTYCMDEDGNSYLLARVTYTNNGTDYVVPGYSTYAYFTIGENKYQASVEIDNYTRFGPSYRIEAKEQWLVYIYASVPDSVKDAGEVKLHWGIPKTVDDLQSYYSSSTEHDTFIVTMP